MKTSLNNFVGLIVVSIDSYDGWRRMAKARITTLHTYNEGDADEIVSNIYNEYAGLLSCLLDVLSEKS